MILGQLDFKFLQSETLEGKIQSNIAPREPYPHTPLASRNIQIVDVPGGSVKSVLMHGNNYLSSLIPQHE